MYRATVEINRKLDRVEILRQEEIEKRRIKVKKVVAPLPNEAIEIVKIERSENKPVYFQEFVISDSEPIEFEVERPIIEGPTPEELQGKLQESYQKGFDDGRETTEATMSAEIISLKNWLQEIDAMALGLRSGFSEAVQTLEDSVVSVAVKLAEKILEREISTHSETVIAQARKAIESLDEEGAVKVRTNPDDYNILDAVKSKLVSDPNRKITIEIISDPKVQKGGCMLETRAELIDAQIFSQLSKLKAELEKE